jgi:hypothetical protein
LKLKAQQKLYEKNNDGLNCLSNVFE